MNAQRQRTTAPPPRTRRVLVDAPVREDAEPCYRSQEGEFVFMSPESMAANDAALRELESTDLNLTMLAAAICMLIAMSVIAFGALVFIHKNYSSFAALDPLVRLATAAVLVGALSAALVARIRNRREGELA